MRPIDREGGDGSGQRGRSLIALLFSRNCERYSVLQVGSATGNRYSITELAQHQQTAHSSNANAICDVIVFTSWAESDRACIFRNPADAYL